MKDMLIFDVSDANTIADSDSVGAFLRASDGTLLTHTDVGGKKALDVRLAEGVNVEVDLSHLDDSVALGDGTNLFTSTTVGADIGLDVNLINASIEVTATALDIRPLTNADVVTIEDGGGSITVDGTVAATQSGVWDIGTLTSITNDVNIADGGNSITVDAIDFDIRDLTAASDSVQSNLFDGAGTALTSTLVGADQALDINVVQSVDSSTANSAILSSANTLDVASTAEKVVAANLASRKNLFVYNYSNRKAFVGHSGVTEANGFPISPGSYLEMKAGPSVDVYYVGPSLGQEIRVLEQS